LYSGQKKQHTQQTTINIMAMKIPTIEPAIEEFLHHKHNVLE